VHLHKAEGTKAGREIKRKPGAVSTQILIVLVTPEFPLYENEGGGLVSRCASTSLVQDQKLANTQIYYMLTAKYTNKLRLEQNSL